MNGLCKVSSSTCLTLCDMHTYTPHIAPHTCTHVYNAYTNCMNAHVCTCTHAHTCTHTAHARHTYAHIHTCIYVHVHVHIHTTLTHVCMYAHIHTTHMHMHTTYMPHTCAHVCFHRYASLYSRTLTSEPPSCELTPQAAKAELAMW